MAGQRLPRPAECPDAVWAAVSRCWATNPSARPTFSELSILLACAISDVHPTELSLPSGPVAAAVAATAAASLAAVAVGAATPSSALAEDDAATPSPRAALDAVAAVALADRMQGTRRRGEAGRVPTDSQVSTFEFPAYTRTLSIFQKGLPCPFPDLSLSTFRVSASLQVLQ
jgi:hypothetical protein